MKGRKSNMQSDPNYFFPMVNFVEKPLDGEREICKVFGCGRKLSMVESLAGKTCTKHMGNTKIPFIRSI